MAAKKAAKKAPLGYKPMPKYAALRVGCKVKWCYYKTKEEAEAAAVIARHNAKIDWDQGYDFGYCSPGSIQKMKDDHTGEWAQYNGLWEVCAS